MNKKLADIISIISNNRYNNYEHLQKNTKILLEPQLIKTSFTEVFKELLHLCKNVKINKNEKSTHIPNKTVNKTVSKTVSKTVNKIIQLPKNSIFRQKIPNFTNNKLFNILIKKYNLYMIKVSKTRYDPYSEICMKALDKVYCVLPKEESISYLKKIKYRVVEDFNKKNIYRLYNYSSKHFKKSELDDIFSNNRPIRPSMLKVFADVFNCNLVYLENSNVKFITKFVDNLAMIIITEDQNNIYCLRTKKSHGYIRSEILKEDLGVNINFYSEKLAKTSLDVLQNLSRMKNINCKKQGKTKKINKTRQELIDELCRL